MKNYLSTFIRILLFIFCIIFLSECKKDTESEFTPIACFDISSDSIYEGRTVMFTDCSSDAAHYEWDFGDGSESTLQYPPSHVYENEGTYTVTLTVYSESKNKKDKTSKIITVIFIPQPGLWSSNGNEISFIVSEYSHEVDSLSYIFYCYPIYNGHANVPESISIQNNQINFILDYFGGCDTIHGVFTNRTTAEFNIWSGICSKYFDFSALHSSK